MARGLRARLDRLEGNAHATMGDARELISFAKEVLAGIEEDLDDSDEIGRRLYRIAKGFAAAAREDPEPGDIVAAARRLAALFGE